jgi:hypothetical protein
MREIRFLIVATSALYCATMPAVAQLWVKTSAISNMWTSMACSADGSRLVAVAPTSIYGPRGIFVSTNAGGNWQQTSSVSNDWQSVAASADGSKIVALGFEGVYVSTNSGFDWLMTTDPNAYWGQVACSGDGTKWIAVGGYYSGPRSSIYISTDSGSTWFSNSLVWQGGWSGTASSADGTKLAVAAANGGPIFISTNGGTTWNSNNSPSQFWYRMTAASDFSRVAVVPDNDVFVRDTAGLWRQPRISTETPDWFWNIACSADGSRMLVAPYPIAPSAIFTSSDSGLTWSSNRIPIPKFQGLAISSDGSRMFAAGYPGGIYTLQTSVPPRLGIAPNLGGAKLSWIVPAAELVLRRSADLGSSWSTVTNVPILNFSNLQYEVVVPATNANCFYRIAAP